MEEIWHLIALDIIMCHDIREHGIVSVIDIRSGKNSPFGVSCFNLPAKLSNTVFYNASECTQAISPTDLLALGIGAT
jgi:hypothetical protein